MKKLTLLFDMDAILVDLLDGWLNWYNKTHNDTLTKDHCTTYHLHNHVKCTADELYEFFTHERYAACELIEGAAESLKELDDAGHDIIITTATAGQTAQAKWTLAARVAPFLNDGNVMVGSRKELIRGDIFVDDAPKNVVKYRNAWPKSKIATIAYPYNRDIKGVVDLYAEDYRNPRMAWKQITRFIHNEAERWVERRA